MHAAACMLVFLRSLYHMRHIKRWSKTLQLSTNAASPQCCDPTTTLGYVSKADVDGVAPYSSTVQLIFYLYEDGDYAGTGACSGTVSQRADVILTAGHCFKVLSSPPGTLLAVSVT